MDKALSLLETVTQNCRIVITALVSFFASTDVDPKMKLTAAFFIFMIVYPVIVAVIGVRKRKRIKDLASKSDALDPESFLELKKSRALGEDFQGVYILRNEKRRIYYVGQSVHVLARLAQHFTGHGNGDVYADYRNGERFTIRTIPLKGSGFRTLNSLERYAIAAYKGYAKGYNKTRGNKG